MRVVNRELPSPLSRHLARHAAAAQLPRLPAQVDHLPAPGGRRGPRAAQPPRRALGVDLATGLAAGCRPASTRGRGIERYVAEVLSDPDRRNDFRHARLRALPDGHRPRHDRAGRPRRGGVGGRADLDRGGGVGRPADGLRAGRDQRPRVHRRGHPLDHQRRRRRRAGAKFIVVINPLVPYVNDFRKRIPTITGNRARRVSDMGITAIGNQAFRVLSHERLHLRGRVLGAALPGRRHHPDRARARRRAHVRHLDPRLQRRGSRSPSTASSR